MQTHALLCICARIRVCVCACLYLFQDLTLIESAEAYRDFVVCMRDAIELVCKQAGINEQDGEEPDHDDGEEPEFEASHQQRSCSNYV